MKPGLKNSCQPNVTRAFKILITLINVLHMNSVVQTSEVAAGQINKIETENQCGYLIIQTKPNVTRVNVTEGRKISQSLFTEIYDKFKKGSVIISNPLCQITICGFSAGSQQYDRGHCKTFHKTTDPVRDLPYGEFYGFRGNYQITSISCGCEKQRRDCDVDTCAQKPLPLGACAVLYQENNCQECYYNGITLEEEGIFEDKNSAVIRSIKVRPGCRVREDSFGALNYLETPFSWFYENNKSGRVVGTTYTRRGMEYHCENCQQELNTASAIPTLQSPPSTFPNSTKVVEESEDSSRETDISTTYILVGIGLSLVIVLVLVAGLIYYLRRRSGKNREILSTKEIQQFKEGGVDNSDAIEMTNLASGYCVALQSSYDPKYEIKREHIIFDPTDATSIIGKGVYGVVYKGSLRTFDKNRFKDVAIKTINSKRSGDKIGLKSLLNEIKVHAYLGHDCPHVVYFLGACTVNLDKGEVFDILEFCESGSLQSYLQIQEISLQVGLEVQPVVAPDLDSLGYGIEKMRSPQICQDLFNNLVKWSEQIASGMDFLNLKKVLHIDLATRNVLLTGDLIAKISDFGLSRKLYDRRDYESSPGKNFIPFKWIALESLTEYKYSVKSDVWAYGVTLWEIFNLGKQPYPSLGWNELLCFLQSGNRLENPRHATQEIYDQMQTCWEIEPDSRPSFAELKTFFHMMQINFEREVRDN